MTTDRLLRTHRLVSQRWRVRRVSGDALWLAHPVGEPDAAAPFDRLADALMWVRTQHAMFGTTEDM